MSKFKQYLQDDNVFVNKCSNCGCGMVEGYMKGCGDDYICSDECLMVDGYTEEEREEDYDDDYLMWTTWEVDADDINADGGFYDTTGKFIEVPKLSEEDIKLLDNYYLM